jgi:hypothetical protein
MYMASKQQREFAEWLLEQVGSVNPYGRGQANKKMEYNIYQSGFLAAYLASLFKEDPWALKRFQQHIENQKRKR